MPGEYPKKIALPDGLGLTLRPMTRDDQYGLYNFFISLTEEDRRTLRNDVTDRKLIEKWARQSETMTGCCPSWRKTMTGS